MCRRRTPDIDRDRARHRGGAFRGLGVAQPPRTVDDRGLLRIHIGRTAQKPKWRKRGVYDTSLTSDHRAFVSKYRKRGQMA